MPDAQHDLQPHTTTGSSQARPAHQAAAEGCCIKGCQEPQRAHGKAHDWRQGGVFSKQAGQVPAAAHTYTHTVPRQTSWLLAAKWSKLPAARQQGLAPGYPGQGWSMPPDWRNTEPGVGRLHDMQPISTLPLSYPPLAFLPRECAVSITYSQHGAVTPKRDCKVHLGGCWVKGLQLRELCGMHRRLHKHLQATAPGQQTTTTTLGGR